MENASKALIMAGGILVALLVIGALLLMVNQLSSYNKNNSTLEKNSQLAAFNQEFVQFTDDEIEGFQLISLVNKVIDYNAKTGVANSVDYDKKITLKIELGQAFANKYGVNGTSIAFPEYKKVYEITNANNNFVKVINQFRTLEQKYTLSTISKLSANYDSIAAGKDEKEQKELINKYAGKKIEGIDVDTIEEYWEYSNLKKATFISNSNPKYDDGQVVELSFKFVK